MNNIKQFEDLAAVTIYHYADCCYKKQAQTAARRLKKAGLIEGIEDGPTAYKLYEEMVADYVLGRLPGDYFISYDYWGARCFDNSKGMSHTKNGFLAGDNLMTLAMYADFKSLESRVNDFLEELDN